MTVEKERKMTLGRMIAYGSGDIFGGGTATAVAALYTLFLTTVAGVEPLTVGMIFLVVKVMSAVINPIVGYVSDRTRSRWGRRRVYFLLGCVPFFALPWIMYPFGSPSMKAVWYGGTFILYNICWSLVSIPYFSILADMTADYGERSKATGIRMVFSKIGTLVGTWLPLTIIGLFAVKERGYLVMGLAVGAVFALPWLTCFLFTWERSDVVIPKPGRLGSELANLYRNFISTLRNSSFRRHLVMYLGAMTTFDIFMAVFIMAVTISMGRPLAFARDVLVTVQICQFAGLPIATWLCIRFSNSAAFIVSAVSFALSAVAFSLMPADAPFAHMAAVGFFAGSGIAGTVMSSWNNLPFIADVDEIITRKRREGIYAGFQSFIRQLSQGLAMLLTNLTLAGIGFVAGSGGQPEGARRGILTFLMIAPPVILSIGILGAALYRVNKKNYDILMAEISRLRVGGSKEDVGPETKNVVESLTGIRYEKLWRSDLVD